MMIIIKLHNLHFDHQNNMKENLSYNKHYNIR